MSIDANHEPIADFDAALVRARAKVLAREDMAMQSELVELRRQAGLSQQDVADRLGITQQAIQKLERYDADPKLSTLRRYANAVGALVEHVVRPDLGQSVFLADMPPWEFVRTESAVLPLGQGEARLVSPQVPSWTAGGSADFVLAG